MDNSPTNAIETEITAMDRWDAIRKRKSPAAYAKQILMVLQSGVPYSTTFVESIPYDKRPKAEKELKRKFELWANSWLAPICREILAKSGK